MPSYLVNGLGPNAQSFPRIDSTGYQSLNSDNGVLSHDDVSLGSLQLSHLFGNHFLRAGFEYRMYNTNAGITTQSNGRYQNTGSYATANSNTARPLRRLRSTRTLHPVPTTWRSGCRTTGRPRQS
jgi:hypothetical protein